MQNTYPLQAHIRKLLPQVKAKYGLKFEVKFDFVLSSEGKKIPKWEIVKNTTIQNKQDYIPEIAEKQIRQILVGLQDVLGGKTIPYESMYGTMSMYNDNNAENLCQKWLGNLQPMFDTNPTRVLEELIELLENLLN
jgi:hypothetical protein